MRIQHNIKALNAHRTLRTNNSREKRNVEKLASGYRINRAADDAAGLNISEQMRAQVTGLDQARANSLDGVSLVETMEGAMEEVHGMLNRMMELAIQSGNDTYSDQNRQTMQEEIDALADEFERIEQTTKFNGISLLQGNSGVKSLTFQIAENTEASSQLTVELADLRQVDVRGISVATADQARESVSKIERGIDYISKERGKVGAYFNRLEYTANNLNVMSSNISASESRIRDVNVAKEEMRRVKNDILGESAQAMLAQANQVPEGLLPLLQQE